MDYTEEQKADILERMSKGKEYLDSIGLRVAVQILPYLQDTVHTNEDGTPNNDESTVAEVAEVIPSPEEVAPIPSDNPELNPNA